MSRYDVDTVETQYQPGSNDTVLLNNLGITDPNEMDDAETLLLLKLYEEVFSQQQNQANAFTFAHIIKWHRQWLGNVYQWAGKIRSVRMWKGDFEFTAPLQLEKGIVSFEQEFVSTFSKVRTMTQEQVVSFLAKSHVEFILLHPFREGNGRISRLLLDYLSQEAGYGLLDYSLWDEHREYYIRSIHAGFAGDYQHMERLVRDILN